MKWLGELLSSFFGAIFGYFVQFTTKKIAIGLAANGAILAAALLFYVGVTTIIQGLTYTFADTGAHTFYSAFYALLPSNATTCMTIIFTVELYSYLYRFKVHAIKMIATSN